MLSRLAFHILRCIHDNPGIYGAEVSRRLGVGRGNVYQYLRRLLGRDLISREADVFYGEIECYRLALTDLGADLLSAVAAARGVVSLPLSPPSEHIEVETTVDLGRRGGSRRRVILWRLPTGEHAMTSVGLSFVRDSFRFREFDNWAHGISIDGRTIDVDELLDIIERDGLSQIAEARSIRRRARRLDSVTLWDAHEAVDAFSSYRVIQRAYAHVVSENVMAIARELRSIARGHHRPAPCDGRSDA